MTTTSGESGLLPTESMALSVGLAEVLRGEAPTPNVATVCILALARLEGRHDWTRDPPQEPADKGLLILARHHMHIRDRTEFALLCLAAGAVKDGPTATAAYDYAWFEEHGTHHPQSDHEMASSGGDDR